MINICSICNNELSFRLKKGNTDYFQCESCKTLYSEPLDQEGLVGGEHEIGRNDQNDIRLARIEKMLAGIDKKDARILDFGSGHGYLVKYLNEHGWNCDGYDMYNLEFSKIPGNKTYDLVTMIEVVEHTVAPFIEIDFISRKLKTGAGFYLETGFIDIANEDKIPLEDYLYVNPRAGHSTIFSHHSIDLMLLLKGFRSKRRFDRNCLLYQKIR